MTKFQLILMGIFGVFIVGGVIIFSAYRGNSKNAVNVVLWGTIPQVQFNEILQGTTLYQSKEFNVQYVEKSPERFDADFIEALASGRGPDLFMLPSDKILKHRNKVYAIPYNLYPERDFKDSFIEGAEIYMAPEGVLALPFSVDPLVMYWNRSIFTDVGLTQPPKYWDEFYDLATLISKKDGALNISRSAAALGEFTNVNHAKEIVLNLAMQAGTPVVIWNGGGAASVFASSFNKPILPAEAALNFYTEFSNPSKNSYSWNRSLPLSTTYFLSGDLGLYFGFASEITGLQAKNPNLNFDVAPVPLSREGGVNVSYARLSALAITNASRNPAAAFSVASILSGAETAISMSKVLHLPAPRRDVLAQKSSGTNAYESVFKASAIRSKSWLDPSPTESNLIFKTMIESITSGRARVGEAVIRVDRELAGLLEK